jgi:hypothetical protein
MKRERKNGRRREQAGTALLIAIFALLLISVVGIALLVSTGTDTALAGNYRTSTGAYYAALAGLEEARGRLLWKNPDFIGKTVLNFVPVPAGPPLDVHTVLYIVNPLGTETVDPTDPSSPYADKEYDTEFLPIWQLSSANVLRPYTQSVSPVPGGSPPLPGPAYKWVRINPITEKALGIDVDKDGDMDPLNPVYFDPAHVDASNNPRPGLVVPTATPAPTSVQALEITAFAVMPSGSTKLLQYVVAASSLNLYSPSTPLSALTLDGNGVDFAGPNASQFYLNGNDRSSGSTCGSATWPAVPALGFTRSTDFAQVSEGIPPSYSGHYLGSIPPATPSLGVVMLPSTLQTPSQLDVLARSITQNADLVISGNANRGNLAAITTMSSANPMTVVANGDLDLTTGSGVHVNGYGLLLVTGTLTYDPDVSWNGIVLVIGKGNFVGSRNGTGKIDGAMLVAQTRDASNNLLPDPNLGPSSVTFLPGSDGGLGIYYNTCWIQMAQSPTSFTKLSFREINLQ